MPSINLDIDYFDHPKVRRLTGLIGRGAAELPVRLWCYCAKYHRRDGYLASYSAQEVETGIGWWGDPGACVAALLKVGLLEQVDGGFRVHDWEEHAQHLIVYAERARTAAKARWANRGPSPPDASSIASSIPNASSNATVMRCSALHSGGEIARGGGCAKTAPAEIRDAARRLVEAYQTQTGTAHDPRGGEDAAAAVLLRGEATEQQLAAAVEKWSKHVRKFKPDKRLSARNFFGGEAPAWPGWINGTPITDVAPDGVSVAERVAKQRRHLEHVKRPIPTK